MIFFNSGTYLGKATIHPIHIRFCTKTETAMAEWRNEVKKKDTYINTLHYSVQSNVVKFLFWQPEELQQWISIYLLDLVFIMTKRFFMTLIQQDSSTNIFRLDSKPNHFISENTNKSVFFQTITDVIFAEKCTEIMFMLVFIKLPTTIVIGSCEFSLLLSLCILHISSTIQLLIVHGR